jgi:hypothetical protein
VEAKRDGIHQREDWSVVKLRFKGQGSVEVFIHRHEANVELKPVMNFVKMLSNLRASRNELCLSYD